MKIGLFFGSFNPIHVGHLIIAEFMASQTDLDSVWLVVSPHSPHKKKKTLANDYDRLHLAELATESNPKLSVSNIEFGLPKPSYTVDTLMFLKEKFPNYQFCLLMGGDNLASFHKWKNYKEILKYHELYIYKRPNHSINPLVSNEKIKIFEAPLMNISSTYIRKLIKNDISVKYLVPDSVNNAILDSNMYK